MSSVPTLPPELWIMIVELALDDSISPHKICDYSNFSRLRQHLRSPNQHPPISNSWANIRLVSKAFKDFAGESPYFFLRKTGTILPRSAKAVYIAATNTHNLSRLLRGRYDQTITLYTSEILIRDGEFLRLDLRYELAFPNLHSLTLHLPYSTEETPFWRRLNTAFPSLACLVLIGRINAVIEHEQPAPVVFENLEIIDIECQLPYIGVYFPVLQHASVKLYEAERVPKWYGVESLLLRTMETETGLDWADFPNLKLLGIPSSHLWLLASCPRNHPLSKLCIFIPGFEFAFVEATTLRHYSWVGPKIQIYITSKGVSLWELRILADECDYPGLELVGVPHHGLRKRVHLLRSLKGISFMLLLLSMVIWDLLN